MRNFPYVNINRNGSRIIQDRYCTKYIFIKMRGAVEPLMFAWVVKKEGQELHIEHFRNKIKSNVCYCVLHGKKCCDTSPVHIFLSPIIT